MDWGMLPPLRTTTLVGSSADDMPDPDGAGALTSLFFDRIQFSWEVTSTTDALGKVTSYNLHGSWPRSDGYDS